MRKMLWRRLTLKERVWVEMARRKLQFHSEEDPLKIELWGLFKHTEIKDLLSSGELITYMRPENKIIWCRPSKDAYEKNIKPLLENFSLEELTEMAGWK